MWRIGQGPRLLTSWPVWASLRHRSEAGARMHKMNWTIVATAGGLALTGFGLWPLTPAAAQSPDSAVQYRVRPHPPARIRVHPLNQTLGPDAVRQCESWLATENRPSGTVIVPRMRCWWERG
jgi:hypothetical protein